MKVSVFGFGLPPTTELDNNSLHQLKKDLGAAGSAVELGTKEGVIRGEMPKYGLTALSWATW
jgi:hypothetical protein